MFTSEECHKSTEKPPSGQAVFINTQVTAADVVVNFRSVRRSERWKNNLAKSYPQGELAHPRTKKFGGIKYSLYFCNLLLYTFINVKT